MVASSLLWYSTKFHEDTIIQTIKNEFLNSNLVQGGRKKAPEIDVCVGVQASVAVQFSICVQEVTLVSLT